MKISVSSYSFNQYLKSGKLDLFGAMDKAKEMGFDAIEFIDLPAKDHDEEIALAQKLASYAKEIGLEINAYTVGACMCKATDEEDDKEYERVKGKLDVASALGAKVFRHDAVFALERFRSFDLSLPTIVKNIRRISDYAKTLGITTCIENHGKICQDSDRVERLFNAVNHENFGILMDVGNFACVDENNVMAVSRIAPYAVHVHFKDFNIVPRSENRPEHAFESRACNYLVGTSIGYGDVNTAQCYAILKSIGYDGYLSVEYEGPEDCIEGIKKGFDNIKKYMA
ncbi:MAG: sugar phosphate isomerase/epimerase [Clostridiales bacterium]|nr:sugar phosphate isomerase/epimerase [Clostridiales bacterium]